MKSNKIISSLVAASILISGVFAAAAKKPIDENQLGMRSSDLYSEVNAKPDGTNYNKDAAGTSKRIQRAYPDAPPMIPHDISDFGEITKDNNACLGCHMPDVATGVQATPIPQSHFTSFRPNVALDTNGRFVEVGNDKVVKTDLKGALWQGRFNCTQCHAPQHQGKLRVENKFKKDCLDPVGRKYEKKSYLMDHLEIGVKAGNGL
ncbi:MAG: nitrate reductase cytochrome c-type subunit [Epsilonproteobacteria bacterium]|nr:nitrate reductase cytochrome c-type subunit [Campylobacterota bacterium]